MNQQRKFLFHASLIQVEASLFLNHLLILTLLNFYTRIYAYRHVDQFQATLLFLNRQRKDLQCSSDTRSQKSSKVFENQAAERKDLVHSWAPEFAKID